MNTRADALILGLLASLEKDRRVLKHFPKHVDKKQTISKKRAIKDSGMRMDHQCSTRQQFRRKTTPSR